MLNKELYEVIWIDNENQKRGEYVAVDNFYGVGAAMQEKHGEAIQYIANAKLLTAQFAVDTDCKCEHEAAE
jgi:hypothetical protein